MHLVIISGAARIPIKSNTAKIITAFCKGFQDEGNTAEVWYLSDRKQWERARDAFLENNNILFAVPLFVENVPGIMLEFLESLPQKDEPDTRISFILQGGFPEVSQSRCCEKFLETLPEQLGCLYGGTLIKGDMFGVSLLGERIGAKLVQPFTDMGRKFGKCGCFEAECVALFSTPEYLSEKQIRSSSGLRKYFQRWFMGFVARRLGCKEGLDARPYEEGKGNYNEFK